MSTKSSSAKAAMPYAEALFELSRFIQLIEKTRKDLDLISSTIKQSKILRNFLVNPLVTVSDKKNIVNNLFVNQIDAHVLSFLFILIERRRINLLNFIINDYISLVNQLDLVTSATVYTAVPLNKEQKQKLQDKLQTLTNSKSVQLTVDVKPDLIAGFVVKIGSKIIDMSISGQLNQISSYLNKAYL